MFVQFFTLLLALCHQSILAHPSDVRSEKPLFVPAFNYPTLVHFNPLNYGALESASLYPQYAQGYGHEYWDSLQRQFPYQDTEKRLEGFLYAGKTKKQPPVHDHNNEDDYKQKPNKLSLDEIKPDLDDLDLKFKRSLTYTSWTPPTLSSTNNLDDRVQPSASRSVPFGPYTTWLPLDGPLVGYGSGSPQTVNGKSTKGGSLKKTNRRRRREVIYADKGDHLTIPPQPLLLHQDYIPVPIAYSTPIIRNVPNTEDNAAVINDVYPAVAHIAAVSPPQNFYHGKMTAALNVIPPSPDQGIVPISHNLVRKK